jgi:solute carrier family 25 oxoglutarate transporter 11
MGQESQQKPNTEVAVKKKIPSWVEFVIGGLAGMSGWMFVHPFDFLKTRLQLAGEGQSGARRGPVQVLTTVIKQEGVKALYSGLSAALMRQATYTTVRLGTYENLKGSLEFLNPSLRNVVSGVAAGAFGSLVSCPVEVCLIRMQADGQLKDPSMKRNYKHIFDALIRIAREEGVVTYWRGATPTVARAMVVSMTQLATYDEAKRQFLSLAPGVFKKNGKETTSLHLAASLTSGLIYSAVSLPLDIAKTRMQNQFPGPDGKLPYKNLFQTVGKVLSQEGAFALWKGFLPYFMRSGGHTVGMFLFLEQYRAMANKVF